MKDNTLLLLLGVAGVWYFFIRKESAPIETPTSVSSTIERIIEKTGAPSITNIYTGVKDVTDPRNLLQSTETILKATAGMMGSTNIAAQAANLGNAAIETARHKYLPATEAVLKFFAGSIPQKPTTQFAEPHPVTTQFIAPVSTQLTPPGVFTGLKGAYAVLGTQSVNTIKTSPTAVVIPPTVQPSVYLYKNQPAPAIVERYRSGKYLESYWLGGEQQFRMVG